MLCCSQSCEKYKTCGHAVDNNPDVMDIIEPFNSFGSGCYSYNSDTHEVEITNHTMCDNYSMYWKIPKDNIADAIEIKQEDKKVDSLDVNVEINSYTYDGSIHMDFQHKVKVHSVWCHDELVEIEHDGHKFIVAQSELEKAARLCANNSW